MLVVLVVLFESELTLIVEFHCLIVAFSVASEHLKLNNP